MLLTLMARRLSKSYKHLYGKYWIVNTDNMWRKWYVSLS